VASRLKSLDSKLDELIVKVTAMSKNDSSAINQGKSSCSLDSPHALSVRGIPARGTGHHHRVSIVRAGSFERPTFLSLHARAVARETLELLESDSDHETVVISESGSGAPTDTTRIVGVSDWNGDIGHSHRIQNLKVLLRRQHGQALQRRGSQESLERRRRGILSKNLLEHSVSSTEPVLFVRTLIQASTLKHSDGP
jgi:hypothetical protein